VTHFSDFYQQVGYKYQTFDPVGFEKIGAKAESLYRARPAHWQSRLEHGIKVTGASRRRVDGFAVDRVLLATGVSVVPLDGIEALLGP